MGWNVAIWPPFVRLLGSKIPDGDSGSYCASLALRHGDKSQGELDWRMKKLDLHVGGCL